MKILQMCVGMFATNCYIVFDEDTKEGAVIDPGANAEGILQAAEQAQVKLTWVLLTHGHFDHILAFGTYKRQLVQSLPFTRTSFGC